MQRPTNLTARLERQIVGVHKVLGLLFFGPVWLPLEVYIELYLNKLLKNSLLSGSITVECSPRSGEAHLLIWEKKR